MDKIFFDINFVGIYLYRFLYILQVMTLTLFVSSCDNNPGKQAEKARIRRKEKNEAKNEAIIKKNEQIDLQVLNQMVDNENANCPKDVGAGIMVQSVTLQDKMMVVNCICTNEKIIKAVQGGLREDVRQSILLSLCQTEDDLKRMRLLRKTHTDISYQFNSADGVRLPQMIIHANELPQEIPSQEKVDSLTRVMFLNNLNADLPQNISDAMIQEKAVLEEDNIVLYVKCDEDIIDVNMMIQKKNENKIDMLNVMRADTEGMSFLNSVRRLDCNIIYRYYGDKSQKRVDIKILKNEMK